MQVQALITALDEEIARLQQARELIGGAGEGKRRGRPKGSTNKNTAKAAPSKVKAIRASAKAGGAKPRRQMSEEGKARIAAAQKARWAAQKHAASSPAKKTRGSKAGAAKAAPKTAASGAIDGRTKEGRAAKSAAAAKKTRGPAKRMPKGLPAMPPPSSSPEVSAQA